MTRFNKILFTTFLSTCAISSAWAVPGNPTGLYLGATVCGAIIDEHDGENLANAVCGGGQIGYQFNTKMAVELFYRVADSEVDEGGQLENADADVQWFGGQFNYFLTDSNEINPYVFAGAGIQDVDIHEAKNQNIEFGDGDSEFLAFVGVGAQHAITRHLAARAFVQANYADGDLGAHFGLGLNWFFEGIPGEEAVEEPVYEEPVVVDETPVVAPEINLLVEFDFDRSEVKQEYYSEVQRVADFMNQYPEASAELIGHTDSIGTDTYNQDLSERRAAAVKNVLVNEFSIDSSRISTSGRGESEPVADNSSSEGRDRNRRVLGVFIGDLTE